ncbi:2-phosphosulfolactate phosphatase [Mechercharimyces sp. CAU 1602]|uniref:2-phosphosulfolactate phosphatase n=1 Tax=Mechercharimyces sp. CAU 1602 TaxID=2973933 RepID=UPI0021639C8B|nr:2-phosphosulfolactate phosphatase [Mechercharimyces sp. CAU 1602]MCS1350761.1 2-phosphosulfolactate phosphatase [Mechercharimyces sp. CAU 1602]
MNITIEAHVDDIQSDHLVNKTVIVIDAFRASTTMVTAFYHEAAAIIPVDTVGKARNIGQKNSDALLGGERFGNRLDGFHFGNSPEEYATERIRNKEIVLTTTNGTRALIKATRGGTILIGTFVNAKACAERAKSIHKDVTILCAGTRGSFSFEDGLAAGCILDRLTVLVPALQLDDLGYALLYSFRQCESDLFTILSQSQSGQRLKQRGLQKDLADCLAVDRYPIVPQFRNGKITL